MKKLSESQIPAILPILFKVMDLNMLCWNIYLLLTAIVLGWIFSSRDSLNLKQKLLFTILYSLAVGVNSLVLYAMYNRWMPPTIRDLQREATHLDDTTPGIREMLQNPKRLFPGGRHLPWAVNLVAVPTVLVCIWVLK
jgi:hypothetical protein